MLRRIWSGDPGVGPTLASLSLLPAEALFRGIVSCRNTLYDRKMLPITSCEIEVVSVGNLRVGGTGKTPFAAWLVQRFAAAGRRPAIVHGGYAPDEPELHRQWSVDVPVIVDRDRVAAVRAAQRAGADVAVLDDGFQHRRLARDVDIVLVGAEAGLSSIRLLPRGPWREPLRALNRADAVVVTRKSASAERAREVADRVAARVGPERVATVAIAPAGWRNGDVECTVPEGKVLAVAALAEPEPFAENAIEAGARVSGTMWFRDHHDYTVEDVQRILEAAAGGPVVTTAKDAVKLESLLPPSRLWVLEQKVIVESGVALLDRITGGDR